MFWFGLVANIFTVLAGLIAIAGLIWAIFGRAQLSVKPQFLHRAVAPSLTLAITSVGSNPVRNLELSAGTLDSNGFSMMSDHIASRAALNRGETLTVIGYEYAEMSFDSEPRDGEFRFKFQSGEGWYLNLQWQSPLFPWLRVSRTYVWAPAQRFACDVPKKLAGRREINFLRRTQDPSLNPTLPSFVAPKSQVRCSVATDVTFDKLVASHKGPVLVAFGPTWQGKWWEDVKRMLDVFAAKYAPRVRVLAVNTDESPALATRFEANEVPVFKVLLNGEVAASHIGAHSMPDLESEFAEHLSRRSGRRRTVSRPAQS